MPLKQVPAASSGGGTSGTPPAYSLSCVGGVDDWTGGTRVPVEGFEDWNNLAWFGDFDNWIICDAIASLDDCNHLSQPLEKNKNMNHQGPHNDCHVKQNQKTEEIVSLMEEDITSDDRAMQELSELGMGEDITSDEFLAYMDQLPLNPAYLNTHLKLDLSECRQLRQRHALYRIKAYKLSQLVPKEQLDYDILKASYPPDVLQEERYFLRFESDGTLDWSFYPDYCTIAALDDYQRLVPHNAVIEPWLDAYIKVEMPLWGRISSRAAYQAFKIATGFPKITVGLVYTAYYDYLKSVDFDNKWYKEVDDMYCEISKQNFRDALDEVYKLNKYPLRQRRMQYALEVDSSLIEDEYYTCTANLTEEVAEDEAQKFILEALKKLRVKPKYYEQYVKKKIKIAKEIGLITEGRISSRAAYQAFKIATGFL
uniref:Uncharacterized protein n=1 Tax=Oryza punctata TaxID=4537 RepID=A0A0E0JU35_ORYPU